MLEVSKQELLTQSKEITPGDHLVALYNESREIMEYVTAYIQSVLSQNARCIYITGDLDTSEVLHQINGLSQRLRKPGDLVILDRNELYAENGVFCPDRLISTIISLVETALQDGYQSLAITGELSWLVKYDDAEKLIIDYEQKLNQFVFSKYPVSALCRYCFSPGYLTMSFSKYMTI